MNNKKPDKSVLPEDYIFWVAKVETLNPIPVVILLLLIKNS